MAKTATRQNAAKPKPSRPKDKPDNKPTRDTRDDPAPNPDAGENQPDTASREDVEKLRRNLKR